MTTASITYTRGSAPPSTEIRSVVGEAIALTITLRNADGTARNCTGGRVEWCFGRRGADITGYLEADGTSNGVHILTLTERDAALLDGNYQHDAWFAPASGPRERAGETSALILERGVGPVDGAALNLSESETGSVIDARVTDLETASATHATTSALNAVSGRVTTLEGNAAGYATTASVSTLTGRVDALEEAGGSAPDISRQYVAGVLSALTLITSLSAADLGIPAGSRATVGLRVAGQSAAGLGLVRTVQATVQNLAGVLSVVAFDAGADIAQGLTEAEAGWSSVVRVAANGGAIEVLGLSSTATSNWTVEVWIASLATLAASAIDTTHDVTLTVDSPQSSMTVPLRWMRSPGITDVAVSEDATMAAPTWFATSPESIIVGGGGARTLYYRGRYGAGSTLTALKSTLVNVVLDSVRPTITAFTMPATANELTVAVTTLTASEQVDWYYNFTGVLPATPPWGAAPTSITFPDYGTYTVYMWCRDLAGNVVQTQSTQTIVVSEPVSSYYSETFATDAAAGAQFDAVYPGWTGGGGVTVNLSASSNAFVYQAIGSYGRARHMGTTALPVEYCVTWRCSNSSIADYSGFNLDVTSDGVTGFQAFFDSQSARTSWYAGHGALQYGLTGWTWTLLTGAGEGWPTSWTTDVVHQITFQVVTISATYSRVYLWIDGQRVGYWQDGATLFTAGRGFGICGEATSGRPMCSILVSDTVPVYDAVSA